MTLKTGMITSTKFFDPLSRKCKLSEKTVRKVVEQFVLLVADELRYSGEVRVKDLGNFYTKQKGGKDYILPTGKRVWKEPYKSVHFKPMPTLTDIVNGKVISKESRKTQRRGGVPRSELLINKYNPRPKDEDKLEELLEKVVEEVVDTDG